MTLRISPGSAGDPIAEVGTGEDGGFEFDATAALGGLSPIRRELAAVVARARAVGFRAADSDGRGSTQSVELKGRAPGPIQFDLSLEPGGVVRGRVNDLAGRPVAEALVLLRRLVESGAVEPPDESAPTDERGEFEIPIRAAGRHRLHAAKFDAGVAPVEDLELEPGRDHDAGVLVLRGAGSIRGRAVFPSGEPVAELEVVALPAGEERRSIYLPNDSDGRGLPLGRTRTTLDGRFAVGGLAPGWYDVSARNVVRCEESGGARPHQPGEDGVELVVERYRLRVRIEDEFGAPLLGASFLLESSGNVTSGNVNQADGIHEFFGRPGDEWSISASAPECLPADARYRFDEGRYEDELALVVRREPEARGSLRLELTTDDSVPIDGATVDVRTPGGALVERGRQRDVGSDFLLDDLPPGRIRLTIRPGRSVVAGFPESSWIFPLEIEAEVGGGEERIVRAHARAGGRLRFTIRVPDGVEFRGNHDVKLGLVLPAGGLDPSLRVVFHVTETAASYGGLDLEPGTPYACAPLLPPGIHTLRLCAPGFRDLERTFTIHAGEFTDVELPLSPD